MIDTARAEYPADMVRAAEHGNSDYLETMTEEVVEAVTRFAHEKPVAVMFWALGIGFVLGWRLRRW